MGLFLGSLLLHCFYMSVFRPVSCYLDYRCFAVSLKLENQSPSALFFFKMVMAILGPLQFHMNFKISLDLYKEVSWDSDREMSFHLLRPPLISLTMFCGFQSINFTLVLLNVLISILFLLMPL